MFPRIIGVNALDGYQLELRFSDGTVGTLDFRPKIEGRQGVFAPLEDVHYFRRVAIDTEAGTLVWPNGVDFCPDVLYAEVTGKPLDAWQSEAAL